MLCGCGELSRDEASSKIKQSSWYFLHKKIVFPINVGYMGKGCHHGIDHGPMLDFLKAKGLLGSPRAGVLELTNEGQKLFEQMGEKPYGSDKSGGCDYQQINVRLADRGEPEVTGLVIDGPNARVDFTTAITPTEIGSGFIAFTKGLNLEQRIDLRQTFRVYEIPTLPVFGGDSHTAHFVKYDDGWRFKE
jgi:hypothetical protein